MVHEAMVLEYSGRHLAMIELAAVLKLLLYVSVIACIFFPFGFADGYAIGLIAYLLKLGVAGILLGVFEMSIAKMRVFRVPTGGAHRSRPGGGGRPELDHRPTEGLA